MKKFVDAAQKAEREVTYLTKKTIGGDKNFQHHPDVAERVIVLDRICAELSLRQKLVNIAKIHNELKQMEEETSKAFQEKAGTDNFGAIFTTIEFTSNKLASGQALLYDEILSIINEWNELSVLVKNCCRLKDLANKHLNDRNFYAAKGEKEKEKLAETDQAYLQTGEQFISKVKTLEEEANNLYQKWSEKMILAHFMFLKDTSELLRPIHYFSTLKESSCLPSVTLPEFKQLCDASEEFEKSSMKFPTQANRIAYIGKDNFLKQKEIVAHAKGTHVVLHQRTFELIHSYLDIKRKFGTQKEKLLYSEMSPEDFISRLFLKRAIVFYTNKDISILHGGIAPDPEEWEHVGKDEEGCHVTLENCLSYQEMQISALIGTCTPTFFINNGTRYNAGVPSQNKEEFGYLFGLVGARFEKKDQMESQHCLIQEEYNIPQRGYGLNADPENPETALLNLWAKFYEQGNGIRHFFPNYQDIFEYLSENPDQTQIYEHQPNNPPDSKSYYINIDAYKTRMRMVIEPFLVDADRLALESGNNRRAFVRAYGLGLGSWGIVSSEQAKWQVDVYCEILCRKELGAISDLEFCFFQEVVSCGGVGDGEVLQSTRTGNSVRIHFSKKNLADPLTGEDKGKLLVTNYPWDSNSFPGNEYWRGTLTVSSDPAAACCSTIAELQNPYINKGFERNIFVSQ